MDPASWGKGVTVDHPGRPSIAIQRLLRWVTPMLRILHRPTLEGVNRLPSSGPFLLVANHSGGLGMAEILCFAALYLDQVGPDRPLAGFAFPAGFHVFPVSRGLRAVGAIPSTYAAAHETLRSGVPILVFPGGDQETLRPIWQANRVRFGGRLGFLKIARAHGVPIVPLGIRGGHLTAPVLFPSRLMAWLLILPRFAGLKRSGLSLLGLLVSIAIAMLPWSWPARAIVIYAWLASPFSYVAWIPWTLRMRIGTPISSEELFSGEETDDRLRAALARVESAVQQLVDESASVRDARRAL